MQKIARTVNGTVLSTDPRRRISLRLTDELAALVEEGFTVATIAKALGVDHNTVKYRLARHGYRELPPSQFRSRYRGRARTEAAS
jgi:transposase-like protein